MLGKFSMIDFKYLFHQVTSNKVYDLCLQFRAARKASEEIGAQLVLGDQPIEITVSI